jgi:hypothetical protein
LARVPHHTPASLAYNQGVIIDMLQKEINGAYKERQNVVFIECYQMRRIITHVGLQGCPFYVFILKL